MEIRKIEITEQDRELLSDFMGESYPLEIDFNWLMPVVDKINNVWFNLSRTRQKQIEITFRAIQNRILLVNLSESHRLVIKFIKWHKSNPNE